MAAAADNPNRDDTHPRTAPVRVRTNPAIRAQRMNMDRSRLKLDVLALCLFFAAVFLGVSLIGYDPADPPSTLVWPRNEDVQNICGSVGAAVAYGSLSALGAGVYVFLAGLSCLIVLLFARQRVSDPALRVLGWLLLLACTSALTDKIFPEGLAGTVIGSGGYLGTAIVGLSERHFSEGGTYLLLIASLVFGVFLTCDYLLLRAIYFMFRVVRSLVGRPIRAAVRRKLQRSEPKSALALVTVADLAGESAANTESQTAEGSVVAPVPIRTPNDLTTAPEPDSLAAPDRDDANVARELDRVCDGEPGEMTYELPPIDLLEEPEPFPYDAHAASIREKGRQLEKTIAEFGHKVRVVQIDTGPVITQYEIALEAGLRVGKIHALADDMAIALKAPAVRVVAPLPNRDTVGVEVPNDQRAAVRLKEVIQGAKAKIAKMRIPLFLGKDVKGNPIAYDLSDMPHLLIAGRTGTGKSVCLNSIILSILMTRRPDEVKMLMIDPKMVELSQYRRIPHLMHPVVTDMKKAEAMLAWAVDKMEERYDILARAGVRHVSTYNQLGADEIFARLKPVDDEEKARIPTHMPYIVILADEMADLMMTAPREVEGHIIRLAQKSRAVGIHLIVATQKPTVDVVTGLIKSNLPARIAFQVSSRSDSRVVLDEMGAEKLLGHGDMLFLVPGTSHLVRAQGTYASDKEINSVVQFLESYEPQYSRELVQLPTSKGEAPDASASLRERDDMYEQAIEIVVREGRGSVSLLQRALGIGYGRAARLIDYMAEDGIVGDYNGAQAREVLYTPEEWEAVRQGQKQAG
jgi:S-DNA-T family DNA segregation ATPase FtsK/SpoIIIE